MEQTLILTLRIDDASQRFYEDLRRRYFPTERNVISAHLTLFHQLSDSDSTYQVLSVMTKAVDGFQLTQPRLRSIGRGVAVFFESDRLQSLHSALSTAFEDDLIPQDRQRFKPHIVIQNKVDSPLARKTLEELAGVAMVAPQATGLTLWRYLGGPWEHLTDFSFRETA